MLLMTTQDLKFISTEGRTRHRGLKLRVRDFRGPPGGKHTLVVADCGRPQGVFVILKVAFENRTPRNVQGLAPHPRALRNTRKFNLVF